MLHTFFRETDLLIFKIQEYFKKPMLKPYECAAVFDKERADFNNVLIMFYVYVV